MEYDDAAIAHGLDPKNRDFVKFIKLRSALPTMWEERTDYALPIHIDSSEFQNLKIL